MTSKDLARECKTRLEYEIRTRWEPIKNRMVPFISLVWISGECSTIHSPPTLFFFFVEVETRSRALVPLFRSGSVHSGLASWDDCARVFPDELRVSSFPDRFPHYACTATHCAFVGSSVYACLGVTCHLLFWQNDRGLLHATAVTRGIERTPNKSRHTKLTLEKKLLPPRLPGFELATSRARRSTNKLSRLLGHCTYYRNETDYVQHFVCVCVSCSK